MIEKLADEERRWLSENYSPAIGKCLRIIDQLTEALAASDADLRVERQEREKWWNRGTAAEARVRELEAAVNNECSLRVQATDAAFELRNHLAAANALLERCRKWAVDNKAWVLRDKLAAHLAMAQVSTIEKLTEESESAQLRERLNVSERGRCQSETLLQKVGDRLELLSLVAHRACRVWESPENHSLHDIRAAMRKLRDVLNQPNLLSTRTEAEQRVLDACATLGPMKEWAERVWAAERARREGR